MKAYLHLTRRGIFLLLGSSLLLPALLFLLLWTANPPPLGESRLYPSGLVLMDRQGGVMRVGLGEEDQDCRPYYRSSPDDWIVKAIIASEDRRFYDHAGVDPLAVLRAASLNLSAGGIRSGASTLTMQLVRLIHPRKRRTLPAKISEAFQALRLERHLTKAEILDQYLNRAPFGSNLVGIESASWGWFGKSPKYLNLSEAALLAGMVQSPTRFRPDRHLDRALKRRAYVLGQMTELGMVDQEQRRRAESLPVVLRRAPRPFLHPFFCDWVSRRIPSRTGVYRTTLDRSVQGHLTRCIERQAQRIRADLSGVVIDVKTCEVRALSCTGDYFSRDAGQVNTALAPRPAGSTLKTFVYADALDGGMISPLTLLEDIPRNYGNDAPGNFSGSYIGPVSVRDALVLSLNIPALDLVNRMGLTRFYRRLKEYGFSTLTRAPEYYGLGLVLGNVSVSLLELCNAYAAVAREGLWRPCFGILGEGRGIRTSTRPLTPAGAWLVSEILGGEERSMAALGHAADVKIPKFAWKTGTSSGFRDAWTVAWNPEYVVGIWCGLKSGARSNGRLVGKDVAAPVAWEVIRLLYPGGDAPWFSRPREVVCREVCPLSGAEPNESCPERVEDWQIRGVSSRARCTLHRRDREGRVEVSWPPGLADYFRRKGREIPGEDGGKLEIASPADGTVFRRVEGFSEEIVFEVRGLPPGESLYWFCDDALVRTQRGNAPFLWRSERGRHVVTCSTESGESDSVSITVE